MDVARKFQRLRSPALGVVVPIEQEDGNLRSVQPAHLPNEEEPCAKVPPIPIVEIPGNDDEIHLLAERVLDEVLECLAWGGADSLRDIPLLSIQSPQRAIEMDIGSMQEPEIRHVS